MTPEGKVKAKVRGVFYEMSMYAFPVNQQGIGRRGIPDDFVMIDETPCFVEFKAFIRWDKNNKAALSTMPTPLQIIEMEKARASGMHTYVVDASNSDEFIESLHRQQLYRHEWKIGLKEYEWYRNASPEFFSNHILREMRVNIGVLKPYETVKNMAERFEYGYRFCI